MWKFDLDSEKPPCVKAHDSEKCGKTLKKGPGCGCATDTLSAVLSRLKADLPAGLPLRPELVSPTSCPNKCHVAGAYVMKRGER